MNLYELGQYKYKILTELRANENIRELLLGNKYDEDLVDELLDDCCYSYLYIPEVQSEAKTFLCVETLVPRVANFTIKDVKVVIYTLTHKSLMKYKKNKYIGTRVDCLADMVDEILNGKRGLAIGKIALQEVGILQPNNNFYGRTLIYKGSDFNT